MIAELIEKKSGQSIRSTCSEGSISTEQDVLDLVGICGGHRTHHVLISEGCLRAEFLNLRMGLAGVLFQKLATYQIRAALVGRWDELGSEKFKELMNESNRGNQVHFFASFSEAEKWLTA